MNNYTTSNELIEILLKNNFVEITEKTNFERWKQLQTNELYTPCSVKRRFKKDKLIIEFDFDIIKATFSSAVVIFNNQSISEQELKSMLYFTELNIPDKNFFTKNGINIFGIGDYLENEIKNSKLIKKKKKLILMEYKKQLEKQILL